MEIEHCPVLGDFCITTYSWPNPDSLRSVKYKDVIMTSDAYPVSNAAIVSLDSYLKSVQEAGNQLKQVVNHRSDQVVIGLRTETAKKVEIVAVRLEKKEKDLLPEDVGDAAKNETEAARQSYAKMERLADLAVADRLNAEDLVTTFDEQPDPLLARKQFLSMGTNVATINDDKQVLVPARRNTLPHKYSARDEYALEVKVAQYSPNSRTATFALVSAFGNQPFFKDNDHGKAITAEIPDQGDVTLVGLCASYGLTLKIVMALKVALKVKGQITFEGTVIRLADELAVKSEIRRLMRQLNADLFDAD